MKTLTIISALNLALIFTGINISFAKNEGKKDVNTTSTIKYHVTVRMDVPGTLCNSYNVEITDANGRPVATPQLFVPGNTEYIFDEQTHQSAGIRIARLEIVKYGPEHFVCDQELFTTPDVRLLHFQDGMVVSFKLFPKTVEPKRDL